VVHQSGGIQLKRLIVFILYVLKIAVVDIDRTFFIGKSHFNSRITPSQEKSDQCKSKKEKIEGYFKPLALKKSLHSKPIS
jgi:hypothetical protein